MCSFMDWEVRHRWSVGFPQGHLGRQRQDMGVNQNHLKCAELLKPGTNFSLQSQHRQET